MSHEQALLALAQLQAQVADIDAQLVRLASDSTEGLAPVFERAREGVGLLRGQLWSATVILEADADRVG